MGLLIKSLFFSIGFWTRSLTHWTYLRHQSVEAAGVRDFLKIGKEGSAYGIGIRGVKTQEADRGLIFAKGWNGIIEVQGRG